jgi:hypothetical protein
MIAHGCHHSFDSADEEKVDVAAVLLLYTADLQQGAAPAGSSLPSSIQQDNFCYLYQADCFAVMLHEAGKGATALCLCVL